MKDIKFRYWDPFNQMMFRSEVTHLADFFKDYELALYGDNNPVLMQFTGLQDINGRDIYEGDLVEYVAKVGLDVSYIGNIVFGNFEPICTHAEENLTPGFYFQIQNYYVTIGDEDFLNNITVIGNIYETAETEEK